MKAVFLDVDGTLTLPGENTVPESAVRAVKKARANGHRIFLSTGRNPAMCKEVGKIGFDGMIACAGGFVTCGEDVLFDLPMTDKQLQTALRVLSDGNVFRTIETRNATYGDPDIHDALRMSKDVYEELRRWRSELEQTLSILPMSAYDGAPVYKIVVMCEEDAQLDGARRLLEEEFDFCIQRIPAHANCVNGELINRRFSKASGMERICAHLKIPLSDTIAFGDSMNDLTILQRAGTSVCMENGDIRLKEICDLICPAAQRGGLEEAFTTLHLI